MAWAYKMKRNTPYGPLKIYRVKQKPVNKWLYMTEWGEFESTGQKLLTRAGILDRIARIKSWVA